MLDNDHVAVIENFFSSHFLRKFTLPIYTILFITSTLISPEECEIFLLKKPDSTDRQFNLPLMNIFVL